MFQKINNFFSSKKNSKLINEISKKLKPNGKLAIYDVMKMSSDELEFPLPWASDKSHDACASVDVYKKAFENSGFNVTVENSRLEFGLGVFEKRKMHSGKTPFGLNVHQENFATKGANMVKNMKAGRMAPYELRNWSLKIILHFDSFKDSSKKKNKIEIKENFDENSNQDKKQELLIIFLEYFKIKKQ